MLEPDRHLKFKDFILLGSLIFGIYFGAGNLIFPVHLGQLAGNQFFPAAVGFISSGAVLPFLGIVAIAMTQSSGVYDLASHVGHHYAVIFMVLLYLTIGPFFAIPRTASVPFSIGIETYVAPGQTQLMLGIYTALFFLAVYYFARKPSQILDIIGRYLNPIFLVVLVIIFLFAIFKPMGNLSASPTSAYVHGAFTNGFLEGYNTMDALGSLAIGIAVVNTIKLQGVNTPGGIAKASIKGSVVSLLGMGLVYGGLIMIGAMTLKQFPISENGGIALGQIAHYYMGDFGTILMAFMTTLTCLSTSVGLSMAFSEAFAERFPRFKYKHYLIASCVLSFLIANVGLTQIIALSTPVLLFLYPMAIVLILVGIISPWFKKTRIIYLGTTIFTIIPAFLGALTALPSGIQQTEVISSLIAFSQHVLPLYSSGFSWLLPAAIGLVLSIVVYFINDQEDPKFLQVNK